MTNNGGITKRISEMYDSVDDSTIVLPHTLRIELASVCNHKCGFCAAAHGSSYIPFISDRVFERCVKEAVRLHIPEIGLFHMGEPTLHPKFTQLVAYLKRQYPDCRTYITTNGTSFDSMAYCVEHGIDSLKVSCNGYDRDTHLKITGVDDFELVIGNLKKLVSYRDKTASHTEISVSMVYADDTAQRLFAEEIGKYVDSVYFTPMYNHAGKVDIGLVKVRDMVLNVKAQYPCIGMFKLCHVKTNGEVNLCRFGTDCEFSVGNIMSSQLDDLWFSEKAMTLRLAAKDGSLTTCVKCIRS